MRAFTVTTPGAVLLTIAMLMAAAPPVLPAGLLSNASAGTFRGSDPPLSSPSCNSPLPQVGGICIYQVGNAPDSFMMVDGRYNFSFGMTYVAEVTTSGSVVAAAQLLAWPYAPATVQRSAQFVNISVDNAFDVTNASGSWLPQDVAPISTGGNVLTQETRILGSVDLTVVYHLQNTTGGSSRVKFDVHTRGWPWVSSGDVLGFAINTIAPADASTLYFPENRTVSDTWNADNGTLASLSFGPEANASKLSQESLGVSTQFGLNPQANPPSHDANVLVTFAGAGGYSSLSYDPLVAFGPHASTSVPGSDGGTGAAPPGPWFVLGAGSVVAATLLLAVIAVRSHRRPLEADL